MLKIHKSKLEELERLRRASNAKRFGEGLLIGAAVGIIAGVLLAPDKGEDSRNRILAEVKKIGDKTKGLIPSFDCCCGDDYYDEDCCCSDDCCCTDDEIMSEFDEEYEVDFDGDKEEGHEEEK